MGFVRAFFRQKSTGSILSMSVHDMWCYDELRRRRAAAKEAERVNASSQKHVDPTRD